MRTNEYCDGRISAFKEMISLLSMVRPEDPVIKAQVKILIDHAKSQIALDESFIDESLKRMEAFQ